MAGHRSVNLLRERMGAKRAAKAKARAKVIQVETLLMELRKLDS
jgi:hypothetical protein